MTLWQRLAVRLVMAAMAVSKPQTVVMQGKRLVARDGEVITCESGHEICEPVGDLKIEAAGPRPSDFQHWHPAQAVMPVEPGLAILPCRCGKPWARWRDGKVEIHVEDEWR